MGFFQDLKMDLSQAVNELMPEEQKKNQQIDIEDDTSMDETLKDVEAALSADFGDLDDGIVEGSEQVEHRDEEDVAKAQEELKKDQKSILKQLAAAQMASLSDVISEEPEEVLEEIEVENEASEVILEKEAVSENDELEKEEEIEADTETATNEQLEIDVEKELADNLQVPKGEMKEIPPVVRQSQWQDYMREKHRNEERNAASSQTIVQMPATNLETQEKVESKSEVIPEAKQDETNQTETKQPNGFFRQMREVRAEEEKRVQESVEEVVKEQAPQIVQEPVKQQVQETINVPTQEVVSKEKAQMSVQPMVNQVADRQLVTPQDILKDTQNSVTKAEPKVTAKAQRTIQINLSDEAVVDETAIITKGMTIAGDVYSKGSLEVVGTIHGNIEILGKLSVAGKIIGDSKAEEVIAESANITGMIHAQGTVKLGANSVVIGDIEASSAIISGAVKGNLDIMGPVILDTTAVVMGNIKSKSVQISSGAIVEGMCSQCYADVKAESFFD